MSWQPLVCVASEQTTGVAHSNRYTHPCSLSICGEPCSQEKRQLERCSEERGSRRRGSAHQLQASLAGEDDGRGVVLRRIGCTLGGAGVAYEHFSRGFVDVGAAGRPTDILPQGGRWIRGEVKQSKTIRNQSLSDCFTTGGPLSGSIQTAAPGGQVTPGMGLRG